MPFYDDIQKSLDGPHGDNATLYARTATFVEKANYPNPGQFSESVLMAALERCKASHIPFPANSVLRDMLGTYAGLFASEALTSLPPNPAQFGHHSDNIVLGQIRDILLHLQHAAVRPEETVAALRAVCVESFIALARHLPKIGNDDTGDFKLRLIDVTRDVGRVIEVMLEPFRAATVQQRGMFSRLREQLDKNMSDIREKAGKTRDIRPSELKASPEDIVQAYLKNTLFDELFDVELPFGLPEEQRFAGHWIIAPPGRGKTTLLLSMFLEDVKRNASIIVLDSKGDLIGPLKELAAIKDRLVLIEPDPDFPLALNPLDIPKANIAHTISLLEYIFSALLEAKMTALQMTLFRSVLPAIVEVVPDATLDTFRDIIENGTRGYKQYFENLSPDKQEFFVRHFDSKTYAETVRRQII